MKKNLHARICNFGKSAARESSLAGGPDAVPPARVSRRVPNHAYSRFDFFASLSRRRAFIKVFEALDIVLAEIAPGLYLDQFERNLPLVGHPVHGCQWGCTPNSFSWTARTCLADGDLGRAAHNNPVLGTVPMLLQRKNSAWNDNDALDLKALAHVDGFVVAPWPVHALMVGRFRALGGLELGNQLAHLLGT